MKDTLMREIVDIVMRTDHIKRAVREILRQRAAEERRKADTQMKLLHNFDSHEQPDED